VIQEIHQAQQGWVAEIHERSRGAGAVIHLINENMGVDRA
jgi:hypothetical protein